MCRREMRVAAALLAFSAGVLPAQNAPKLTIDTIMRGPGLVGYEPEQVRWSGDSSRIYFGWKKAEDPVLKPLDTYVVNRDGSGLRRLSDEEARLAPPWERGELPRPTLSQSPDRSMTVFAREGDIFLYDAARDRSRPLTRTAEAESNPHFTRDGRRVWFTRAGNLFLFTLGDGSTQQFTDIHPESAEPPGKKKGNASQEFLKKEQNELLDIIRQRTAERERAETEKKKWAPPVHLVLKNGERAESIALSPDEKVVVVRVLTPAQGAKDTTVRNYVTESGYTDDISSRTKVGDAQPTFRLALIDTTKDEVHWVDHGQKAASQPRTETKTSGQETLQNSPPPAQERAVMLLEPIWSEDGTRAVMLARASDNKDRWVLALDANTGKTRVLATVHDDAWVDGPGANTLGWMKGDRELYFQSERDGYSHLYRVPYEGGEPTQVTSGKWEVQAAKLSTDKSRFWLLTNEGDSGQVHLYSMAAEGGARTKITSSVGKHSPVISPDDSWIADVASYTNRPPELFSAESLPGAQAKQLTTSPTADFRKYNWVDVPVVKFRARDGAEVRARLFKPAGVRKGGPAVVFVHGAGYLQNVHRWWSQYYREYMFHNLLLARGYVIADVDYRGSAGYGRDWRTGIYRHMGGKDLDDIIDAAKWLVAEHGVDAHRIGVYGGSYGGFITLMAMFREPDTFAAGAALRPVTDWAHYNAPYTSNILNLPQNDAEAYRQSSPIYFAEGLKGALLICHGVSDVNVHLQDTVRLAQRLIELRKENWEVAMYPAEDHTFVEATSWADEYKRILRLFDTNLRAAAR